MKKRRLLVQIGFAFLFLIFVSHQKVEAAENVLENLSIHVYINGDGSARITEERLVTIQEGTEQYIVIGNLGNSQIKDFVVTENGTEYEFVDTWDLEWSREEKAFKNGLIPTETGYELSWGIGEYGEHTYTVSYTVTDFIKQTKDDQQILFWRFVNDQTNMPAEQVEVQIESEKAFRPSEEKIWAYGYEGRIEFVDTRIQAVSEGALETDNYVTVLVQFPPNTFQTGARLLDTFEEIRQKAEEGSDYGSETGSAEPKGVFAQFFDFILSNLVWLLLPFAAVVAFVARAIRSDGDKGVFKPQFKEEYYRELPYPGPVSDIYYLLYTMGLTDFEELLTGYLLKWIYEGHIQAVQVETGKFFKKETTHLTVQSGVPSQENLEGKLFDMLKEAAGDNQVLEGKEFSEWANKHASEIEDWTADMKDQSLKLLEKQGYILIEQKKMLLFFTKEIHVHTPKAQELEERIYKFVNYLSDYSLLNEQGSVNVALWDKWMIWAGFFGITEEVMKEFKKVYPEYESESVYHTGSLYYASQLSRTVSESAIRASGGGGSSSMGGGGGSFGGGSGGGTR